MEQEGGVVVNGVFYESPLRAYERWLDESIEVDTKDSETVDFYRGKSLLITGGTGFMGKVTVEKLLRVCPEVDSIYVLIREKKGKPMHERMDSILRDPLFSHLKEKNPNFRNKITLISGDVALPDLGISHADRNLLTSKVQIIIHAAASVNLDSKLKSILEVNFFGTQRMMELARECCALESFVFVSTAFAHCGLEVIEEKHYKPLTSPDELLAMIEGKTDEEIEELVPRLLANTYPNTYQFTKAVVEQYLEKNCAGLPLVIFRPSIIMPTYKEPLPGWTDNIYGPTGLIVAGGMGLIHTTYIPYKHLVADLVPVDYCVNAMLVAATKSSQTVQIYNYTSGCENPIDWNTYFTYIHYFGKQVPVKKLLWFPLVNLQPNYYLYSIETWIYHYIPGAILDLLLVMSGKKPKMIKVYKKIHRFLNIFSLIYSHDWKWTNENTQALWKSMSESDRQVFPFSMKTLDWPEYCRLVILGIRTYLWKEELSTLEEGRRKYRTLKIVHYTVCCLVVLLLFGLLSIVLF